jgi:ubiquinone/menaquinone biosynthesis C-methylase UbiE
METENFSGVDFGNKARGFEQPTQLPRDASERSAWQASNKAWWEATPMRYDWREGLSEAPGSEGYFQEIDRRFLDSVRKYMPWRKRPFETLIDFDRIREQDVLEIGVGQGTHAQLIAPHCRSYTGIDLTSVATEMTKTRLKLFKVPGEVLQMDAEDMDFPDGRFDYIWSWGVIHHSADTKRVLTEMHRVLRAGGAATVMIYYRSWWTFYFCGVLRRMFLKPFAKMKSFHHVAQGATDGAIARHYTSAEWRETSSGLFNVESCRIYGLKNEILPLPQGRIKARLERMVPDIVARFMTNHLRMGTFLVAHMRRV